jgi:hypothetical protein
LYLGAANPIGDYVRSRNPVAVVNESLAKFVCFNLNRVILSQVESGIEPTIWPKDDPARHRDVIPLRCRG